MKHLTTATRNLSAVSYGLRKFGRVTLERAACDPRPGRPKVAYHLYVDVDAMDETPLPTTSRKIEGAPAEKNQSKRTTVPLPSSPHHLQIYKISP